MAAPSGSPPTGTARAKTIKPPADVVTQTFTDEAKAIAQKAAEAAKGGDVAAMRLVLDRIAPAPKERAVNFAMPVINGPADVPAAVMALLNAVAEGQLVPGEAMQLAGVLEHYRKQIETAEFEARLKALEEANARKL